jgi:hypothetical protein
VRKQSRGHVKLIKIHPVDVTVTRHSLIFIRTESVEPIYLIKYRYVTLKTSLKMYRERNNSDEFTPLFPLDSQTVFWRLCLSLLNPGGFHVFFLDLQPKIFPRTVHPLKDLKVANSR